MTPMVNPNYLHKVWFRHIDNKNTCFKLSINISEEWEEDYVILYHDDFNLDIQCPKFSRDREFLYVQSLPDKNIRTFYHFYQET
jgi:hypothetical protein